MELFPNIENLQIFCIEIISNERIHQEIPFNRYKCIQLVLNSMINFQNKYLEERAFDVCVMISRKLSIAGQLNLYSNPVYMKTFLVRIITRLQNALNNDIYINYNFAALISYTKDSPKTCELFVESEGIDLCFNVLNV